MSTRAVKKDPHQHGDVLTSISDTMSTPVTTAQVAHAAENAVQRLADA